MKAKIFLLSITIVTLLLAQTTLLQPGSNIYIEVYPDLSVLVKHFIPAEAPSLVEIEVLGPPQYLIVTNDLDEPLIYNLTGRELVVLLINGNAVKADYIVEKFVNRTDIGYQISIHDLEEWNTVTIELPSHTIVLDVDPIPAVIKTEDSRLILEFHNPSSIYVEFMYEIVETGGTVQEKEKGGEGIDEKICILGVASAALFAIPFLRFRKTEVVLTEEEEEILKFVKKSRGRAYLKDIREVLELPASTAWRRVKRMEKLGVVKLYKTPHGILVVKK
ncbi:MAG: hypothetical protein DRJ37_04355 [Thermoprotei archaeon]|nr:MAG: hypothetical protein DRJ37_04355 [Thermoprotei archaeon]